MMVHAQNQHTRQVSAAEQQGGGAALAAKPARDFGRNLVTLSKITLNLLKT
ncbi:MAG TPA: hypothetical protein VMT32_01260 [Bryobacteraceae bacterium]|nr:hypothetical protein [Bryobacteraceae bacterium]